MKTLANASLIAGAALVVALVFPGSSEAAGPYRGRTVRTLSEDTTALSREVMARINTQLLEKDLRWIMALPAGRTTGGRTILNRDPILDANPINRSTILNDRLTIPFNSQVEQKSFTESLSGVGFFENSTLKFGSSSLTGQRTGFLPGNISASLQGQVASSFGGSDQPMVPLSVNVAGSGFAMGDTLISGSTTLGISANGLGGSLSSSDFKINSNGTSGGNFSGTVSAPAISMGVPITGQRDATATYSAQPQSSPSVP